MLSIKRAGSQVTKIYSHYTYEQERFKRDFILMNQGSRQNAKDSVEKDFFKLLNNAKFVYEYRKNWTIVPLNLSAKKLRKLRTLKSTTKCSIIFIGLRKLESCWGRNQK